MDLRSLEETRDQVCWILPHPALLPLYCLMVTQNPLSVSVTVQVIHGQQPLLIVAFKDLFLLPCFLTSYLIKPFSTLHKAHPNCHLLTQYSSFIPSFSWNLILSYTLLSLSLLCFFFFFSFFGKLTKLSSWPDLNNTSPCDLYSSFLHNISSKLCKSYKSFNKLFLFFSVNTKSIEKWKSSN